MILTRTPLRISFGGGGSDLPGWYMTEQGAVLSATIDKYVYVALNDHFEGHVRVSYSETENVKGTFELRHDIIRECLNHMGVETGVEVVTIADVPGRGTGLGSSSALAVGLLNAIHYWKDSRISLKNLRKVLAQDAFAIESEKCHKSVGKQDHYAAAYGGINYMRFNHDSVEVDGYYNATRLEEMLTNNLVMYYTGMTHDSEDILAVQKQGLNISPRVRKNTAKLVSFARQLGEDFTSATSILMTMSKGVNTS